MAIGCSQPAAAEKKAKGKKIVEEEEEEGEEVEASGASGQGSSAGADGPKVTDKVFIELKIAGRTKVWLCL